LLELFNLQRTIVEKMLATTLMRNKRCTADAFSQDTKLSIIT